MAERETEDKHLERGEAISVSNEFAFVNVRKVLTRNGERLEIEAPRGGVLIRLDALELEAIAGKDPAFFTSLLDEAGAHSTSEIESEV